MIDMHSHILPNIDDGAKNIDETYNLIKEAENVGFNGIVVTSHYMEGYYEADVNKREELVNKIYQNLEDKDIKIYLGSEIYLSEKIIKFLKEQKASTINNTSYVLFEMPLNIKPMNLYNVVYEILQYKLIPILAHPERYSFVEKEPELINNLIKEGVLMQANYGSIIGQYGVKAQILVKKFLENDMIHLLGTDAHRENTIYPKIPEILSELNRLIGESKVEELSNINPKLVINNKRIDISEPKEIKLTLKDKMIMTLKGA